MSQKEKNCNEYNNLQNIEDKLRFNIRNLENVLEDFKLNFIYCLIAELSKK